MFCGVLVYKKMYAWVGTLKKMKFFLKKVLTNEKKYVRIIKLSAREIPQDRKSRKNFLKKLKKVLDKPQKVW